MAMNGREATLRVKRFEADESAKKIEHLEIMINDFESLADDLDRQIAAEEERTGIRDRAHFAYSTFAKSAAQRRDNLRASAAELKAKLEVLVKDRGNAEQQIAQASVAPRVAGRSRRRTFRGVAASAAR
jgi:hypothetical protein